MKNIKSDNIDLVNFSCELYCKFASIVLKVGFLVSKNYICFSILFGRKTLIFFIKYNFIRNFLNAFLKNRVYPKRYPWFNFNFF